MFRPRRGVLAALAVAAVVPLAAAAPCAARGTGGFLRDWSAAGPLEGTNLDQPEAGADFAAYPGLFALGGVWLPAQAEPEGRLDLRALYPGPRTGTALLHTFVDVPADGTYCLRLGSDDAIRVDIDGRTVHRNDVRRSWSADQDRIRVELTKGWHRMLVRVVDYGGEWAASVRVADGRDQPLDVRHQAACPETFGRLCRLGEPVTVGERAEVAAFLAEQVTVLEADLEAAVPRLAVVPEGYVTFAEYEGARNLGRMFFEAMASFWREAVSETLDEEAARAAQHMAAEGARGFSEVLAQQTDRLSRAVVRQHKVWETLGGAPLSRRDLATATLQVAELVAQTRQLAARVENERLLTARFENDIRNFRQRDVAVRVLTPEGGTVDGAQVEIVQTDHDFGFGCNLFAFRRWGDDKKNALYEKRFRALFNVAVVPMYWSVIEKRRDHLDLDAFDAALRWCGDNNIQVRAHPLLWTETVPRWVEDLEEPEARAAAEAHVRRLLQRYRETVQGWDVIQGPRPEVPIGRATLDAANVLAWAADARPTGLLLVSGDDPRTLAQAGRHVRAAGRRLDGVGITAHQHDGAWSLDQVRRTLDQVDVGAPVHVSAVTLLGPPEQEAEQAEAVLHFYTAAFAHPKVAGITWWDLSDRFAWKNAPAGLLREDLSLKPAYKVLDRLINNLWRTDAAGRTDHDGRVRARVFFGQYRITAQHGRRKATVEVHIGREGPGDVEIILPPER